MELKFIGRGAAFNQKEGNNSAFFTENDQLFLIDCGENVFERIIQNDVLNGINTVNLMITHTHSDHIGSLGSLIMYCYYKLHTKVNIILPSEPKYVEDIKKYLKPLVVQMICLLISKIHLLIKNLKLLII